jgi:hypothetical protein
MPVPPGPEVPKPPKPRLTPDQVLEKLLAVQRQFEVEKSFRRPDHDPWRRLFWVLGGGLAFTTIALLLLRMALSSNSPGLLSAPEHSWIVPPASLPVFLVESRGSKMALHAGSSLMVAASGEPLHLEVEGGAGDREALLVAEDDFGRLTTVWPRGGMLHGGACPNDCTKLDVALGPRVLPAGKVHLALWIGPGPLDGTNLQHLGRAEPAALPGSRASTWLTLER